MQSASSPDSRNASTGTRPDRQAAALAASMPGMSLQRARKYGYSVPVRLSIEGRVHELILWLHGRRRVKVIIESDSGRETLTGIFSASRKADIAAAAGAAFLAHANRLAADAMEKNRGEPRCRSEPES